MAPSAPAQPKADKSRKLRQLRLADERARREAGTWGDVNVSEIVHAPTRSTLLQFWKGARRPDPGDGSPRPPGFRAEHWKNAQRWAAARNADGFVHRSIAVNVSGVEAERIIAEHAAARETEGYTVTLAARTPAD
ncbi:MAG: hypothetical protein FJX67_06345 [Alphaproteobacteria bacterium]|nr:hypothetical protein [Alphaproteobacteria bacterium]